MGAIPASYKKNVKMTVTVATPDGDITGSAVREISNAAPLIDIDWPHGGNPAQVFGEALVIDMGERGVLFALLDSAISMFYSAFPPPNPSQPQEPEAMRYFASLATGKKAVLSPEQYGAKYVTFADIKDPTSVMLVKGYKHNADTQEYEPINRMEALFGEGVYFKEVRIEITEELITSRILTFLPWLNNLDGHYLHGGMTSKNAPLGLHEEHFLARQGVLK